MFRLLQEVGEIMDGFVKKYCLVSTSHIKLFLIRSCFKLCFTFKMFEIFHTCDTHLRSVSNGSCVFDSTRTTNGGILFVCFWFFLFVLLLAFLFNSFFFFLVGGTHSGETLIPSHGNLFFFIWNILFIIQNFQNKNIYT